MRLELALSPTGHVHVLGEVAYQAAQYLGGEVVAARVVGIADHHQPGVRAHGVAQRAQLAAVRAGVHRHRPGPGACSHEWIEGIGGPRRHKLFALGEQCQRGGLGGSPDADRPSPRRCDRLPRRNIHPKFSRRERIITGMAVKKSVMKNHFVALRPLRRTCMAAWTHVSKYSTAMTTIKAH